MNHVVKLPSQNEAIAIGQFVHSSAPHSIGIGYDLNITGEGATAIGTKSTAQRVIIHSYRWCLFNW